MSEAESRLELGTYRRVLPAVVAVTLLLIARPVAVLFDLRDLTEQLSRRQANDM